MIEASEMDLPPIKKINTKIGFIGDGNMAKAICKGIIEKGIQMCCCDCFC